MFHIHINHKVFNSNMAESQLYDARSKRLNISTAFRAAKETTKQVRYDAAMI